MLKVVVNEAARTELVRVSAEAPAQPASNAALGELGCCEAQPVDDVTNSAAERRPREDAGQRRNRVFGTHTLAAACAT
jgi:hypothetical protein